MLKLYVRALRLPFVTASILPFVFGSFLNGGNVSWIKFILGLISVISIHLSANLMNDYSDSRSGADWQDKRFFGLFGGSKLIQEGLLSEKFYFVNSILYFIAGLISVSALACIMGNSLVLVYFFFICFLGFSYSHKPFQFCYRYLGEAIIFILFGVALVTGGYFIQTGIFPSIKPFLCSLPFAFFVTAILFANEVPDYPEDVKAGKFTLVHFAGVGKSYVFYYIIIFFGFFFIFVNILLGYLNLSASAVIVLLFLPLRAGNILMTFYKDKARLLESSRVTISFNFVSSIILILSLFF